jgi:hypothetical protein
VVFLGFIWAAEVHDRADATQVTKAAYAKFGGGSRIVCIAQDRNNATWYCSSARWGDNPNCRTASVGITGSIDFAGGRVNSSRHGSPTPSRSTKRQRQRQ